MKGPSAFSLVVIALLMSSAPMAGQTPNWFTDKAALYGVVSGPTGLFWGNGVCFYDLNNDGLDDLTLVRTNEPLRIYLSTGDGFEQMAVDLTMPPGALHLLWVDYDNDGDLDVYLTVWGGYNRLYQNEGDFTFTEVTTLAGLPLLSANHWGASFGDFDRDGYLDLYVCRYYAPADVNGHPNALYRNNGNGTFTEVGVSLGVSDGLKPSFLGTWVDINNDLWPDLFVINDRFPSNSMYLSNGDGTFSDITTSSGLGFPFNDPMSNSPCDYDNDGDIDIFFSNGGSIINMLPKLLENNGDSTFTDVAQDMGISNFEITWGGVWVDIDNDGWRDLYYCTSVLIPNSLYKNNAAISFSDISTELTAPARSSYSCANGDFNGDGYADLIVHNVAPSQPLFLENTGGTNHYIKTHLTGTVSNRQAIGAWINVYRGAESYAHYTLCGEGFNSQNSQNIIFGLGDDNAPLDSVLVTYPSGHKDTYYNLAVDSLYHFVEGDTYTAAITFNAPEGYMCPGDSIVLNAGIHHNYLWNTGDTTQYITVYSPGNYAVEVTNIFGVGAAAQTEVLLYTPPSIAASVVHPLCFGEPLGQIALINQTGIGPQEVLWQNGLTGANLDSLLAGKYSYQFTDLNGCSSSGLITLTDPPQLIVVLFVTGEVAGADGSIFISVFGGTPPYNLQLDSLVTDNLAAGLAGGSYLIVVTDANGCQQMEEVEVPSVLHTATSAKEEWKPFPNPTSGTVQLPQNHLIQSMEVLDTEGRLVWKTGGSIPSSVDLGHLPKGAYTLRMLLQNQTVKVTKLIIQ